MAKNLETYEITQRMREDLLECYRKVAPNCLYQHTAWERTVTHPAKSFYITPKQCYQRINLYIKGRTEAITSLKGLNRQRFEDLLEVIEKLHAMEEYKDLSLRKLCNIAVEQPAPRFYITSGVMGSFFYSFVRKRGYDEYGRNLRYMKKRESEEYRKNAIAIANKHKHKYVR